MNISYAVTVCNEHKELSRLLEQLLPALDESDEILVQADEKNYTKEVLSVMNKFADKDDRIKELFYPLNSNFAEYKNNLFNYAKGDYIIFIDADEYLSDNLLSNIKQLLSINDIDLIMVPRANTVSGLTQDHINKWGWRVENDLVNWPDFQMRIVKNSIDLRWNGKVHERIVGYKTMSTLPIDDLNWCFFHPKDIERQERQNDLYSKI
jgi:glycosyltransferase involved in cell wall biosynthesis